MTLAAMQNASKIDAAGIRPREEALKRKWAGVNERTPINSHQYSFAAPERLEAYIQDQFPDPSERDRYRWYREEWYRRAKEFDPGEAPLAVTCELVSTCNLGCSMCYTISEEFQTSVVGAQRMLPWPIVRAVIDEAAELGVPSMLFSWRGESSMYRSYDENRKPVRFPDVLAYARRRGILEVTSLTHGQLIDDRMAADIVAAEPSWISFSIDGLAEAYNKIRTPSNKKGTDYDAFEIVTGNVRRLVAARQAAGKTRPQIRVNSVFPAIARDPDAYRRFMEGLGVGWVTVNELLDFRGEDLPDEAIIGDWACQYPFQRLTVSANGIVLPCTGAHNEEDGLVLGRYRGAAPKVVRAADGSMAKVEAPEISLRQAWHGEKIDRIRRMHKDNRRQEIDPGCRNCRHGAVKHGVGWVPDDWNMETMEWEGGTWRE